MNKFMKSGAMMLMLASCTMGVVSCTQEDPFEKPVAPVVTAAPNSLSGTVKTVDGTPVANAQVKLSGAAQVTAMTNAEGVYQVSDLKAGTYQIDVTAAGYVALRKDLVVAAGSQGVVFVCDALLYADKKSEVVVSTTQKVQAEVRADALPENTKAEVMVEVEVPAAAVEVPEGVEPNEVKVIISPLYSAEQAVAKGIRAASENTMMTGATISCNKEGVKLTKKVDLSFELDASIAGSVKAMKYTSGAWKDVESKVVGGKVVIAADEFADYGLFLGLTFSERSLGKDSVSLAQKVWDNFYGKSSITVENIAYNYKSGASLNTKGATVLEALMIEKLAALYGAKVNTLKGSYPAKVFLPVGTKLTVNGQQEMTEATVSTLNHKVTATTYGKVSFNLVTTSREHTGGSSSF